MLLSDTEYNHVIDLIDKKLNPTPLLIELTEWMKKEFEVQIYDYICDYIQSGQIRLKIVLWDNAVQNMMRKIFSFVLILFAIRLRVMSFGASVRKFTH